MAKIESADQATEIAVAFLKEYHTVLQRPHRARLEQKTWVVEVDIGAIFTRMAKVSIDADTGRILEYDVPPSPFPPPPPGLPEL